MTTPILLIITGQSNAVGANNGGPNPAPATVKAWDATLGAWGSSDYTQLPWSASSPRGNGGKNNIGLSAAIRLSEETGRNVYVVYYAIGGSSITNWDMAGGGTYFTSLESRVNNALGTPELAGIDLNKDVSVIWAQGEEDFTMDFTTYLSKLTTVMKQFRSASWCGKYAPICLMGMSPLHYQYAPIKALHYYGENVDRFCTYINSAGMLTQFLSTGTGDNTHWLGESLWEAGYYRCYKAIIDRVQAQAIIPQFFNSTLILQSLIIPRTSVTISNGELNITGSSHSVYAEGAAASDDLIKINGGVNGMHLFLRASSSSQTIVIKDAAPGGNIELEAGDIILDNARDVIHLYFDSGVGKWLQVSFGNNGA